MIKPTNKELEKLKDLIRKHGLDVTWLNYGGFTSKISMMNYHPDFRAKHKDFEGLYSLGVGSIIYQVFKNQYHVALNEKQNEDFQAFVKDELKKPKNRKGLKECFNSYTYEITVYSDDFLSSRTSTWYTHLDMDEKLPLNASKKRDTELFKQATERANKIKEKLKEKGKKVLGSVVTKKYLDTHYTHDEWVEILELCIGSNPNRNHPTSQSKRFLKSNLTKDRLKNFKEVTLKTTGRKMLIEVHPYGWNFVEIEPIIT